MTTVSDDPSLWPVIDSWRFASYFIVASSVIATYDWALTFGQEVELVWRQRWSLMTVLYISVRYLGIISVVLNIVDSVPIISVTDAVSFIMYIIWNWMCVVVLAMLQVIIITRLHAMYQRSRRILIFLIVTFLTVNTFNGVVAVMMTMHTSGEEFILVGTYQCTISYPDNILLLGSITWILSTVWEVLALCLAVWIAVKHFRELRQHSAGGIIGDCFMVLIQSHVIYFASFAGVSCISLISSFSWTPIFAESSLDSQMYDGFIQIVTVVQSFVLGPRVILDIREYHAKLVADSDAAASGMTSIAFQERVHISTGSGV